jgi:hypothetical protein
LTYTVHKGYLRVLAGLNADISHGPVHKSGNAYFRMTYAQFVIDKLATELEDSGPKKGSEASWRSKILNPILQRQLNGYHDHEAPMLKAHFDGLEGAELQTEINKFYLSQDPLAALVQPALRRGILYVTEPRWFLGINDDKRKDSKHYDFCRANTTTILSELSEQEDRPVLQAHEVCLIVLENLEDYYREDAQHAVSSTVNFVQRSSAVDPN